MKLAAALKIVRSIRPIAAPQPEGDIFIYFFRAGEYVKIGKSFRWRGRLADMQTGSPYTIIPLLVLKAEPSLERELHKLFYPDHVRGEWFRFGPAIARYIKSNLSNCVVSSGEAVLKPFDPWDQVR
jgi:hypothetical protein